MIKQPGDLTFWFIYDRPAGHSKRYLVKKWHARGEDLIQTFDQYETDDIEKVRKEFLEKGYYILRKQIGKLEDVWLEPDEVPYEDVG